MKVTVYPGSLSGEIRAIASKSHAHRLLICAALSHGVTRIACPDLSEDIRRTADCLQALCSDICYEQGVFTISPREPESETVLHCGESGSTYRFILPVCAALGGRHSFGLSGRLPRRPMDALFQALAGQGIRISGQGTELVTIEGKLSGGRFEMAGNVSSQFISGLALAAPLTGARTEISLTTPLQSAAYVDITLKAAEQFGIRAVWRGESLVIEGGQCYKTPGEADVEGDWSNAAFWLAAAAAGDGHARVLGLDVRSSQGDKGIIGLLRLFGAKVSVSEGAVAVEGGRLSAARIDVDATPDLAPVLALLGAAAEGETILTNIARLRLKESDRAASITQTLAALGADIRLEDDCIKVRGRGRIAGGSCDAQGDHRIAMMAACAAVIAQGPIAIGGAQAVSKSYPLFFEDLQSLGLKCKREE